MGNSIDLPLIIGYVAAALTTIAFLPQAVLTWKLRSAHGVSLGMYSVFVTGVVLWIVYGFMIMAWPIIVCNLVTVMLAAFILYMKIRYG